VTAFRGDRILEDLAEQYDVHPNQPRDPKQRLPGNAEQLFEKANGSGTVSETEIKEQEAKIGERKG
jgi:hypothetical protein